ncbi:MAG: glycosyltransferase family 2 protein [Lactobacillaceae bacterium]
MRKKIQVLLATYNGSQFLKEQITSVLENFNSIDDCDCSLLISDDGSSDITVDIINGFCEFDDRIVFLDGSRKGGVKNNFNFLIKNADADYIFFCDQDDFWLPNKLTIFLEKFSEIGKSETPLLLHSDLCVVDIDLSPIHASMFKYQRINKKPSFSRLLVSNSITGCVMAINHALLSMVKESSVSTSIMHDWYIGLIASSFGEIHFIPKSLILYRQHGNNQVGAKKFSSKNIINGGIFAKAIRSIDATKHQAKIFYDDFRHCKSNSQVMLSGDYYSSFNKNFIFRLYLFLFKGIKKFGVLRNFLFFLLYVFFANSSLFKKIINQK